MPWGYLRVGSAGRIAFDHNYFFTPASLDSDRFLRLSSSGLLLRLLLRLELIADKGARAEADGATDQGAGAGSVNCASDGGAGRSASDRADSSRLLPGC